MKILFVGGTGTISSACHNSQRETLQPKTEAATRSDATVYTDEWSAY